MSPGAAQREWENTLKAKAVIQSERLATVRHLDLEAAGHIVNAAVAAGFCDDIDDEYL